MTTEAPEAPTPVVRLHINLSQDAAAYLREWKARGVTATETVRRALAVYKYVMDERAKGNDIALMEGGDPRKLREIQWLV